VFLLICQLLGNKRLSLAFLASQPSSSNSHTTQTSISGIESTNCQFRSGSMFPVVHHNSIHILRKNFFILINEHFVNFYLLISWIMDIAVSRHCGQFLASDLHRKCDNRTNTITIILTAKVFIFGSFTPVAFNSASSAKGARSPEHFVFSLNNCRNTDARKFSLSNPSVAIYGGEWMCILLTIATPLTWIPRNSEVPIWTIRDLT
jgi:hypothetical protein